MKFHLVFLSVLLLPLLHSCNSEINRSASNNTAETKALIIPKDRFPVGQIIENVVCKTDTSQRYVMYLPSNYSINKTFPVMYVFDPHGDGKLPVSLYKNIAEKYGYILIGSNNSKNGNDWETSANIAATLFSDSQNRLSIHTGRIYLLGFSGGARIANGLTITNGAIAGVICCGAASPPISSPNQRTGYTFLGIAGNKDFNYVEMRKYDMIDLAGRNVKHAFIEFDGKHEWPTVEIMSEAFLWTELGAMRTKTIAKNDSIINENFQLVLSKIKELHKNKNAFGTYHLAKKTINFFDGLTDLTECYTIYNSFKTNAEVDNHLKQEEASWQQEESLKQFYIKALQTKNLKWWETTIASATKKIKNGKNKNEALTYARTLNYLSLLAYMQASAALKQNNIAAAKVMTEVYILVDPTNSEAHYLTACIYARENNKTVAVKSLNESIRNGFTDIARLQSDSSFVSIHSSEEFKAICKKLDDAKTRTAAP